MTSQDAPTSRRAARARQNPEIPAAAESAPHIGRRARRSAAATPPSAAVQFEQTALDLPVSESSSRAAEESTVDAFTVAAEAFGFGGDLDGVTAPASAAEPTPEKSESAHQATRRRPRLVRKVAAAGATLGVMGIASLMLVSMTLPAEAVAAAQGDGATAVSSLTAAEPAHDEGIADDDIQAYVASSDVQNEQVARDGDYSSMSLIDVAAEEGIKYSDSLYTNDPEAAIQWPYAVGVAMSSPYGQRWGRLHAGIDLVPGNGAPIQAIADGVVRKATENGGGYGVTVYIDHMIDGQVITSHYSHMQFGSLKVRTGQQVKVGDIIGATGNTGHSYGAHLHFELLRNGSTFDPLPWMKANAGRYDGVGSIS